jgi:hypothetical protein
LDEAQRKHPKSFISGEFALCDYFFSLVSDPQKNSSTVLQSLFSIQETRSYLCPLKISNHQGDHPPKDQRLFVLQVSPTMFERNEIPSSNATCLIAKWLSSGLDGGTLLQCQRCSALRAKKRSKSNEHNSEDRRSSATQLNELSILSFPDSVLPPHLYFQVDAVQIVGYNNQMEFMGQIDWPFKLEILGKVYTLISRGYWGNDHY